MTSVGSDDFVVNGGTSLSATRGRQLTQYGVAAVAFFFFFPQTKIEWWSEVVAGQGLQEVQAHPDHTEKVTVVSKFNFEKRDGNTMQVYKVYS